MAAYLPHETYIIDQQDIPPHLPCPSPLPSMASSSLTRPAIWALIAVVFLLPILHAQQEQSDHSTAPTASPNNFPRFPFEITNPYDLYRFPFSHSLVAPPPALTAPPPAPPVPYTEIVTPENDLERLSPRGLSEGANSLASSGTLVTISLAAGVVAAALHFWEHVKKHSLSSISSSCSNFTNASILHHLVLLYIIVLYAYSSSFGVVACYNINMGSGNEVSHYHFQQCKCMCFFFASASTRNGLLWEYSKFQYIQPNMHLDYSDILYI